MRILVDIGHPAHVHFFKHAIIEWQERGHKVLITARDKDIAWKLLDSYGFEYANTGRAGSGILGIAFELLRRFATFWRISSQFAPDVMVGIGGTGYVHVGRIRGIPSLVFTDTEHAALSNRASFPFADRICTPVSYKRDLGSRHVRYDGYHELAYLHPNYFVPDADVIEEIGMKPHQMFFLIRFVSWGAAHDVGQFGFSSEGKRELVARLSGLGRVFISSESVLPAEFESYRVQVSPERIHDLLAYSSLYVGEGGTMASEAVLLGVPAIFVNTLSMGYVEEQQDRYGMLCITADENTAIEQAVEWASGPNVKQKWQVKRQRLLDEKIDVTAWMVEFVEQCV